MALRSCMVLKHHGSKAEQLKEFWIESQTP